MTDEYNDKAAHEKRKDNAIGLMLAMVMVTALGFYGWYASWLLGGTR
jgi:hypothetical protein